MKRVKLSELTNAKMVAGNEKKYPVVIHNGQVREWVGIGWLEGTPATKGDFDKYPVTFCTNEFKEGKTA